VATFPPREREEIRAAGEANGGDLVLEGSGARQGRWGPRGGRAFPPERQREGGVERLDIHGVCPRLTPDVVLFDRKHEQRSRGRISCSLVSAYLYLLDI
jgi:hypothetical protein